MRLAGGRWGGHLCTQSLITPTRTRTCGTMPVPLVYCSVGMTIPARWSPRYMARSRSVCVCFFLGGGCLHAACRTSPLLKIPRSRVADQKLHPPEQGHGQRLANVADPDPDYASHFLGLTCTMNDDVRIQHISFTLSQTGLINLFLSSTCRNLRSSSLCAVEQCTDILSLDAGV